MARRECERLYLVWVMLGVNSCNSDPVQIYVALVVLSHHRNCRGPWLLAQNSPVARDPTGDAVNRHQDTKQMTLSHLIDTHSNSFA